jgi:mannose-6-phosphate isomerase
MKNIGVLQNPIQEYAWGSRTAIAELLGQKSPADKPQAELWMGAHPRAPSLVFSDGAWRSLLEVIREHPEEVLGTRAAAKFSGTLPFLFKVLAAAKPLSIQAHPNREQAERGFARENTLGIPLDAPHRNYRDQNHKPEIICALTPFWALNGFRRRDHILEVLQKMHLPSLSKEIADLRDSSPQQGLKGFSQAMMTMTAERQDQLLAEAMAFAERQAAEDPVSEWIIRLQREYPGDIGTLSPAFLNLVRLEPGQAMFLQAGELHAYLEGVGIELMANSDNVLRGGLTPKHIDVSELLAVLTFAERDVDILTPQRSADGEGLYLTPAEEFQLSIISVSRTLAFTSKRNRSVEIVMCANGEATIMELGNKRRTHLARGTAVVIPAAVERYRIEGQATLCKAAVPP